MTGKVTLRHQAEEGDAPEKGDLRLFLNTESKQFSPHHEGYQTTGMEGYVKAELFDGKGWRPLSLEEFFSHREYYFGKRERPIDTCLLCREMLAKQAGAELIRLYREHYVKKPDSA
jgi:hypothetical protein